MNPTLLCPRCGSPGIISHNYARKVGGAIGTVAGASGGFVAATAGAETGAAVGLIAGPPGALVGGVSGAIIGALLGGAAGCATGAMLGTAIDNNILDNHECKHCGHTFSSAHPDSDS